MGEEKRASSEHPNTAILLNVGKGFDYLFSDDIVSAKKHFEPHDDPIHLLGLGVCTFFEAALGLESGLMAEASRCLTLAEAGTRKQLNASKPSDLSYRSRFQYGLEWEVLHADAVVLLGLTHALSESYMGYLQCMYALKSSHSKFTKLFKIVFPNGLPPVSDVIDPVQSHVPQTSPVVQPFPTSTANSPPIHLGSSPNTFTSNNFLSRWIGMSASTPALPLETVPDGPVEDLIVSGTACGFGLFNLIFSLLPKKARSVVGFFGFQHDRSRALEALSISSAKLDLHGVFASLVLMTYLNTILALSGYQADEQRLLREVQDIVSRVEKKYPSGSLLVLNRAKVERMAYNAESAIHILQGRLQSDTPRLFLQADIMLAWALLSQRRYLEASEAFTKITKLNSWSYGTYTFLIAGCLLAAGDSQRAQELFDKIPAALERKKSKRELPPELYIKRKLAFYKDKHRRRGSDSQNWIEAIKINPAEEFGIFWNIHSRVKAPVAQARIDDLMALTPPVSVNGLPQCTPTNSSENHADLVSGASPKVSSSTRLAGPDPSSVDLDSPDELAIRALLLGVNYRTQSAYEIARVFLTEATKYQVTTSQWVAGLAMFEMAVLDLKETEARTRGIIGDERKSAWTDVLTGINNKLDSALSLSGSTVDLSGRFESRVAMLRDEITAKAVIEGISL